MTFARQLERLRQAAAVGVPGCPPGKVTVDVRDLRELLHHFDRIDAELRAIHQTPKPAQQAGYCADGDRCNCGGDLPRVREGCVNWRKAAVAAAPALSWIDPNDKSRKQFLPWIGEPVLFCHDGVTYYGQHTGGSFQTGQGATARRFNTWACLWMYPPEAAQEGGT